MADILDTPTLPCAVCRVPVTLPMRRNRCPLCAAPMIPLCHCGGCGVIREGHYPDWREIACDSCDRVEFGRNAWTAVERWCGVG